MSVKSFIPQLQGVRNLIDLALSSSLEKVSSLVFASSISDLQSESEYLQTWYLLTASRLHFRGASSSDCNSRPNYCDRNGVRRIKMGCITYIGDFAWGNAFEACHCPNICGNHETGSWNPWEWFPSIVRSAKAVRSLPEPKGVSKSLFGRTNPIDTSLGAILDSCWHCCLYNCRSAESWRSCVSS